VSTEYPRFSTNLTRLDISRLTPLLNSQTADTIWLEIHHELPELWKTPPHGDSSDEHEEITICLRGFISVTTHGYTTLKLSECLHKQPHGLSTNATVEIYGALWDRRSSSKSIWNHKDTHADFELISYSQTLLRVNAFAQELHHFSTRRGFVQPHLRSIDLRREPDKTWRR
jgi:hypothetical protein